MSRDTSELTEPRAGADPAIDPDRPPRQRRSTGRRTARRRARRRRAALRGTFVTVLLVALGAALVWGAARVAIDRSDEEPAPTTAADGATSDPQPSLVLATFDEAAPERGASQIVVLAVDRDSGEGTILLVPPATVADIPGHGLLHLGRAYGFGEGPLLDATLDNLLGVDLDGVAGISRQGWAALFTRLEGLELEVPERLDATAEDGSREARFRPGEQFLDGPRVAELLTFSEANETQLDSLPRVQLVLSALLDRIAADPSILDLIFDDGAPMVEGADPDALRDLLVQLADARQRDALVVRTLPVSPVGSGEEESYRLDEERADRLVAERLAPSVPTGRAEDGRALQILNGNGAPGIGQHVAQQLIPEGFRVVKTGNADRFDHAETRIIVYSDDPQQVAVAERIRELLGVGRVEYSRQPFSVADVTVVVGLDFLEQRQGRS